MHVAAFNFHRHMAPKPAAAPSPGASPTKARPADAPAFAAAAQIEDAAGLASRLAAAVWEALPGESSAAAIASAAQSYLDALASLSDSIPRPEKECGDSQQAPESAGLWRRVVPRAFLHALDACEGGQPDRALAVVLGDLAAVSRDVHEQSARQCALADELDALLARTRGPAS